MKYFLVTASRAVIIPYEEGLLKVPAYKEKVVSENHLMYKAQAMLDNIPHLTSTMSYDIKEIEL